jgi:Tfp pilus assembly protein PilF
MGNLQRAISSLSASTTIAPRHVAAHLLLASASQKAGDLDKAKEAYERALEIQPDSAAALVNYGALLRAAQSSSSSSSSSSSRRYGLAPPSESQSL